MEIDELEKELIYWISDWLQKNLNKHNQMVVDGKLKFMDAANARLIPILLRELDGDIQHIIKNVIKKYKESNN